MKHRLVLALVVLVLVPLLITFRVSSTPSASAPSPTAAITDTSETSLRSLAQKRGINIGAAVAMEPFYKDATYRKVLAREFNVLVPENAMKFAEIHPKRHQYNFTQVDTLVAFAKAHDMQVRGHPLVWHYSLPNWLEKGNFTRDELKEILREHIQTVVGRYRGQIPAWDIANEVVTRDGSFVDSIWLREIGPEYLDLAFRWAHEADPKARLYYNEYSAEDMSDKSDAVYNLANGMLQRGVPIHGIGLQMHKLVSWSLVSSVAENIKRIGKIGLEVSITEMDISIAEGTGSREERLAKQAQIYGDMMRVCVAAPHCKTFAMWGFTDRYTWATSWLGTEGAPLIFDESYRPKASYKAIEEALKS
ncbi:MAG TPA: 1,4-beta-xylanase [Cyanobacteria bacterium UBA8553]|nr:1,4-beta-xylanase [Cyanobacteria bacterium UBA8553]HAJ61453.1 1,4-beta-xylanase [Cyanobacteria bacterium UBA8543]